MIDTVYSRLLTLISVPINEKRSGWKTTHRLPYMSDTGFSSVQPFFFHPIPATKAMTKTAKAPAPLRSMVGLWEPNWARIPPRKSMAKRRWTSDLLLVSGKNVQSTPHPIPNARPARASIGPCKNRLTHNIAFARRQDIDFFWYLLSTIKYKYITE